MCCDVVADVFSCFSFVFFYKQKTAYELRISDWSSDVCSSDLGIVPMTQTATLAHPKVIKAATSTPRPEIGRASSRERVCQYVWLSVVAVSLKKKLVCTAHSECT